MSARSGKGCAGSPFAVGDHPESTAYACLAPSTQGTLVIDDATGEILPVFPGEHSGASSREMARAGPSPSPRGYGAGSRLTMVKPAASSRAVSETPRRPARPISSSISGHAMAVR